MIEHSDFYEQLQPYAAYSWDGSPSGRPVLHLDDFSGIPFLVDITGVEEYQHRARLRAGDRDLFAAVTRPSVGYEPYCRRHLRLGSAELLLAEPVNGPLSLASACGRGEAMRRLVEWARRAGAVDIHPFMGIEAVWELARNLAREAGVPVTVIGPPPPTTWIANDKAAFGELVGRILGEGWLVETHAGNDSAALARQLRRLAERHDRVALKRVRCASAMGNEVYDASILRNMGQSEVEKTVCAFLKRTEWDGKEEVLAVAWEDAAVSPSTQLWIPPPGAGAPLLDGIYEQILQAEEGVFVGSRPSRLPAAVNRALATASIRVAEALQALSYCGRCSFDFLVSGDPEGEFRLRFTECNGRWGGTSTPMALLDRLMRPPRPFYRAQDFIRSELIGVPFPEILASIGNQAYDANTGHGRFIFYNIGPLERFGKLDVIALGRSQQEAETAMEEDLPRLLGL